MEMKTLLLPGDHISTENVWCADAVFMSGQNSPAEVLYRIKILVSRKRGPKKQIAKSLLAGLGEGLGEGFAGGDEDGVDQEGVAVDADAVALGAEGHGTVDQLQLREG